MALEGVTIILLEGKHYYYFNFKNMVLIGRAFIAD